MLNVGPGELIAISMVALIVLGPQRLPGALRQVGKFVGELRKMSTGFQDELRNAFDDAEIEQARRTMEASTPESSPAAARAKPIDATGVETTSVIDDDADGGPEPTTVDDIAGEPEPEPRAGAGRSRRRGRRRARTGCGATCDRQRRWGRGTRLRTAEPAW